MSFANMRDLLTHYWYNARLIILCAGVSPPRTARTIVPCGSIYMVDGVPFTESANENADSEAGVHKNEGRAASVDFTVKILRHTLSLHENRASYFFKFVKIYKIDETKCSFLSGTNYANWRGCPES